MELERIRKRIDAIDAELALLINQRLELALLTRRYKSLTTDQQREIRVLGEARRRSQHLLNPDFSQDLFQRIIDESKKIQERNPSLAGFQGEHGAYSEEALSLTLTEHVSIPCQSFKEVLEGVEKGELDVGI
ncbi:MAG: chorismate mutase, partial [Bdellovibrionales bacterium]|nr:chorismate mutase [Bdellovibrionales bacterium]